MRIIEQNETEHEKYVRLVRTDTAEHTYKCQHCASIVGLTYQEIELYYAAKRSDSITYARMSTWHLVETNYPCPVCGSQSLTSHRLSKKRFWKRS